MIINENRINETLIVSLEGRLDTTTSPDLDAFLEKNFPSINELILTSRNWITCPQPVCA